MTSSRSSLISLRWFETVSLSLTTDSRSRRSASQTWLRFGAYPLVEFVLPIRVPLHQRHAVDVRLDGEGRDGETPAGGGGLPRRETVHGLADPRALVGGLLGHLRTSAASAVEVWVTAAWRSRAALARSRLPMCTGACAASWSISSARPHNAVPGEIGGCLPRERGGDDAALEVRGLGRAGDSATGRRSGDLLTGGHALAEPRGGVGRGEGRLDIEHPVDALSAAGSVAGGRAAVQDGAQVAVLDGEGDQ